MINRIPKFHEVIELFYDHGLFKWSKTSLPRKGQSLEQRQRREQAIVEILVQQLAGGADDPLLRPVLGNLRDMHRHLGLVTLFPDREVCGSHFYFWLLVWPQLELMFEDALQHEHGSIPLRYLAHCYQRHGANLFNEKVLSRRVILASLGEQLSQALSDAGINSQKAAAAQSQVLKKLGRLIRHDSFPSRTSVDEPLRELTQALARLPKKAEAISRHLLQLLEGEKSCMQWACRHWPRRSDQHCRIGCLRYIASFTGKPGTAPRRPYVPRPGYWIGWSTNSRLRSSMSSLLGFFPCVLGK